MNFIVKIINIFFVHIHSRILYPILIFYFKLQNSEFESIERTIVLNKMHRNFVHAYYIFYFNNKSPEWLISHREYFKKDNRGYGEDAFHALWYNLIIASKPRKFLEIGVYRGQVISLVSLISQKKNLSIDVFGLSPFSSSGDTVSIYTDKFNYIDDVLLSYKYFNLDTPNLIKGFSNDNKSKEFIKSKEWDMIYIDGNHDFEVVLEDYYTCLDALKIGGILILDDSSVFTKFKAPLFSFAGHVGPSKIFLDYANKELMFLGSCGHLNILIKTN